MNRTGVADLPLHGGKAPKWLFNRMVSLSTSILDVMVEEFSVKEIFLRFSDPYWFQSLSCILGYDWHSSGTTTVTCSALKKAVSAEKHGFIITGGKGKTSRKTPEEIKEYSSQFHLSTKSIQQLIYASKITAKIDSAAIQDHHTLYHHCFFFSDQGLWGVIQQGMNEITRYARRYHWCSEKCEKFLPDPHTGIIGEKNPGFILNMVSKDSISNQKTSVDLLNDHPRHLQRDWESLRRDCHQRSLDEWCSQNTSKSQITHLAMPRCLNWRKMHEIYDKQPKNYEELIGMAGIGASTVRALALISELIYGANASWNDPVKYSYAHGGKDGVPYPVDSKGMDTSIQILKQGIQEANLGSKQKLKALKRLHEIYRLDA